MSPVRCHVAPRAVATFSIAGRAAREDVQMPLPTLPSDPSRPVRPHRPAVRPVRALVALLAMMVALAALVAPVGDARAQSTRWTQPELEQLLAPIALYPDALLAQVLMASAYPAEVRLAAD